jgi:indole-3-glycerol phosphate synthase
MNRPDILKEIVEEKWREVEDRQKDKPVSLLLEKVTSDTRGFYSAIESRTRNGQNAVIAEIKKASPSKGIIRDNFEPVSIAKSYETAGAACLSVLTDSKFFKGSDEYLVDARSAVSIPVLRKDFIIDPYQIHEARCLGADCILLIVSILDKIRLQQFSDLAITLGMDVLVEVHDEEELELALEISPKLLGINNRNLRTFEVDLQVTLALLQKVPAGTLVITESGIHTRQDVELMNENHVYGFLVGESFMRETDPGAMLSSLFG